jgi:hypothetical protein
MQNSIGAIFLLSLTLPAGVTAIAGVQALWWLAAAIALIVRSGTIAKSLDTKQVAVSQPV